MLEALAAVMAGEAELVGQFTLDGQTVKARLVNPLRAHGGLILFTDTCGSQSPMHRVRTLESEYDYWHRHLGSDLAREMYNLVGKCMMARSRVTQQAA